jgi:hypothetical protein
MGGEGGKTHFAPVAPHDDPVSTKKECTRLTGGERRSRTRAAEDGGPSIFSRSLSALVFFKGAVLGVGLAAQGSPGPSLCVYNGETVPANSLVCRAEEKQPRVSGPEW